MKHIIEAPDGSRHIIEGPDPATVPPINVDPSQGMPWYEKALVGAGAATDRAIRGIAGLAPSADNFNSQGAADAALYQKHHPGGWATAGEIGADVAMGALPVAKGGQVLTKTLSKLGRAAPLAGDVAANALYAAATAPEDRGTAALLGAGGAAAGRVVGGVLTGFISPTKEAAALRQAGVHLTPGQMAGKESLSNWAEQVLASNPVSAYPIRAARAQSLDDAGQATVQEVRKIIGADKVSRDMSVAEALADTRDQIGSIYQEVVPKLGQHVEHVRELGKGVLKEVSERADLLGPAQKRYLENYMNNRLSKLAVDENGNVSGELLKQIDSEIGYLARQHSSSTNALEKVAGPAWYDLLGEWRNKVIRNTTDDKTLLEKLDKANGGWKALLAVEEALHKSGGERIQPARLVRALEKTKQSGPLTALAQNMKAALPNTVPDSGTALRLTANLLPMTLAGVGGYGASSDNPLLSTLGLGAMAAGLSGTRMGASLVAGYPQAATVNALRNIPNRLTGKPLQKTKPFTPKTLDELRAWLAQGGRAYATQGGQR